MPTNDVITNGENSSKCFRELALDKARSVGWVRSKEEEKAFDNAVCLTLLAVTEFLCEKKVDYKSILSVIHSWKFYNTKYPE